MLLWESNNNNSPLKIKLIWKKDIVTKDPAALIWEGTMWKKAKLAKTITSLLQQFVTACVTGWTPCNTDILHQL